PVIFVAALALLLLFHRWPAAVSRVLDKVLGLVSKRLAAFATGVLERFHSGLGALPDLKRFWAFVAFSAVYWGVNAVAFYLLARGCGLDLPIAGAVAGMGVLAVGILLPAGPGYFGNFQIAVLAALTMYLPRGGFEGDAPVFIFLLYVLQTGLTILFGAGGALALSRRKKIEKTTAE
ncbi:MAG: flippase-like domain-containing protein, partial [Deltaproteobacteria bacterium]|nr:flippase-like domain-containing protein [Deltaproteobacteria bacterium]